MTKSKINKAIKHLGLEIVGTRGDGYFYFLDFDGYQIGESVYVCYLSDLTLDRWVDEAEHAIKCDNDHTPIGGRFCAIQ